MERELNEETLQDLYAWIDTIPLSRPKRNITRDFSDGVMAAEVVKYYFPKLVEIHNYSPANSTQQKLSNWCTLNRKVLSKLSFHVPQETVKRIVVSLPGVIEPVLCALRERIEEKRQERTGDALLDVEYYNARSHDDTAPAQEARQTTEAQLKAGAEGKTRADKTRNLSPQPVRSRPQGPVAPGSKADAGSRLLEEKDLALLALQETVEILQIKVKRLESLVHLKDIRLEDLTRRLEGSRTNMA